MITTVALCGIIVLLLWDDLKLRYDLHVTKRILDAFQRAAIVVRPEEPQPDRSRGRVQLVLLATVLTGLAAGMYQLMRF